MHPKRIWVWKNNKEEILWCSKEQCGIISNTLNPDAVFLTQTKIRKLRSKTDSVNLKSVAGDEISQLFSHWLQNIKKNEFLSIELLSTLPETWQLLPWEWISLAGEQLHKKFVFSRYAGTPATESPKSLSGNKLLLNLWPLSDPNTGDMFNGIIRKPDFTVASGHLKSNLFCKDKDLSQHPVLCIIAHGNETNSEKPFLTENNQDTWAPELGKISIPPLLLLLACSGEQGNLVKYGQTLLESPNNKNGCKTVLATQGRIDAAQAAEFLKKFISEWDKGISADEILFKLQQDKNLEHAALRIHIVGSPSIKFTTEEIPPTNKTNITPAFLEQLTISNFIASNEIGDIPRSMYAVLGIKYDNPHEKREILFDPLHNIYDNCSPLTQKWLSHFLLYLSSIHEHKYICQYQAEIRALKAIKAEGAESFHYYIAHGYYKDGNYLLEAKTLVDGLNSLSHIEGDASELVCKLQLSAVHNATDMNLYPIGEYFITNVQTYLQDPETDDDFRSDMQFICYDHKARLLTRKSAERDELTTTDKHLIESIENLSEKRKIAIYGYKHDGERELSGLLLISAWLESPDLQFRNIALEALSDIDNTLDEINGNLTKLYLLQGLAAWAWLQNDKEARELSTRYLSAITKQDNTITNLTSGPLGAFIAYLSLAGNKLALKTWHSKAAARMHTDFYYFELAIYQALLGEEYDSKSNLDKFHLIQRKTIDQFKKLKTLDSDKQLEQAIQETEAKMASFPDLTSYEDPKEKALILKKNGLIPL